MTVEEKVEEENVDLSKDKKVGMIMELRKLERLDWFYNVTLSGDEIKINIDKKFKDEFCDIVCESTCFEEKESIELPTSNIVTIFMEKNINK